LGEIGQHITEGKRRRPAPGAQAQQPLQETKPEPPRTRTQFADIQWIVAGKLRLSVAAEGEYKLGIGIGNNGVAGYVMRHFAKTPCRRAA
jgi:hypothetical protein